jgi:predicted small lipoprotein YifL
MRKILVSITAVLLISTLASCSGKPLPEEDLSTSTETTSRPTTRKWTKEEQAAADAVDTYLETYAHISQNITTYNSDDRFMMIKTVATDPQVDRDQKRWNRWEAEGLYLVGSASFTAEKVIYGATGVTGNTYYVYGCHQWSEEAHTANPDGSINKEHTKEVQAIKYTVFHSNQDKYFMKDNQATKDVTCQ